MVKSVGILIFDDVEVLDFAGPFEVFSRTRLATQLLHHVERHVDAARASVDRGTVGRDGQDEQAVADETAHYIEYRRSR